MRHHRHHHHHHHHPPWVWTLSSLHGLKQPWFCGDWLKILVHLFKLAMLLRRKTHISHPPNSCQSSPTVGQQCPMAGQRLEGLATSSRSRWHQSSSLDGAANANPWGTSFCWRALQCRSSPWQCDAAPWPRWWSWIDWLWPSQGAYTGNEEDWIGTVAWKTLDVIMENWEKEEENWEKQESRTERIEALPCQAEVWT